MTRSELHRLAARGAVLVVAELETEAAAIRSRFPDLATAAASAPSAVSTKRQAAPAQRAATRPKMTRGQRAAVSARMTQYWSDWRKARNGRAKA